MDTLTVKVWKLDFSSFRSPAAKLVALAIARRARDNGMCWAKQTTLADDCGVSPKTVHRVLCELEERQPPWVKRVERRRKDGSRTSDYIWLTLPEVVLEEDVVAANWRAHVDEAEELDEGHADTAIGHDGKLGGPASPVGRAKESEQKESLKDSKKEGSLPADADSNSHADDVKAAVDLIWKRASDQGRRRSSKADIEKALLAALGRGHAMERVLRGLRAYFESADATKDDGAYQRGAHVMLANDRWESFLDDDEARAAIREDTDDAKAARAITGTLEAPSEAMQRTWMQLFGQGMPWNPERGPEPGRLGCRVDEAIQREFGVTPYAAPGTADDAAFD